MPPSEPAWELDTVRDPAYPTTTPPDPMYPRQTLEPMAFPFDGIATPAMWSRLESPLERVLNEFWERLALLARGRPGRWVTIHFGRIAINAHGWERLRAQMNAEAADPSLVAPPERGLGGIPERWERLRGRLARRSLPRRIREAEVRGLDALTAATRLEPRELDAAQLARGPLGEPAWTEILLPWIGARLTGVEAGGVVRPVAHAIGLEQRFGSELGRRLVARGALRTPEEVAYLTVEERLRAVHEGSHLWSDHAASRAERVAQFVKLELPLSFWGRPRPEEG